MVALSSAITKVSFLDHTNIIFYLSWGKKPCKICNMHLFMTLISPCSYPLACISPSQVRLIDIMSWISLPLLGYFYSVLSLFVLGAHSFVVSNMGGAFCLFLLCVYYCNFQTIGPLADSFIESQCPSVGLFVCLFVPFPCNFQVIGPQGRCFL